MKKLLPYRESIVRYHRDGASGHVLGILAHVGFSLLQVFYEFYAGTIRLQSLLRKPCGHRLHSGGSEFSLLAKIVLQIAGIFRLQLHAFEFKICDVKKQFLRRPVLPLLLALPLSVFIFTGCSAELVNFEIELRADESNNSHPGIYNAEQFSLFRDEMLVSGRFEPMEGTYIGAYILSDRIVAGDIEAFERITGREHSFYTYFLKMGQRFPSEWVLNCVAHMKTPNIILSPANIEDPFNRRLLRQTARSFGEISVPMFVHFFPVSHGAAFDADEYIAFFRDARTYFNRYASNVALVWVIDSDSLHLIDLMYPGDDYVDWVGINLFVGSQMSIYDVRLLLDSFYFHFQQRKPIFISQLGISHFSSVNHAHHVAEATRMMEGVFEAIIKYYPRIKAINYMSLNSIDPVNNRGGIYNFSVTDNEHITRAYAASVGHRHFLSRVDTGAGSSPISQRISHPNVLLYYDGDFFVRSHMDIGLQQAPNISTSYIVSVGALEYYPLALAVGGMGAIRVDFDSRSVEIVPLR